MNKASGNKTLLFIIAALLLTNIAVLVYFLRKNDQEPDKSHRGAGLTELLLNDVGFSNDQVEQYKQLKERQRETIRPMFDEMRKAKDSLFRLMSDSTVSDSVINNAANVIAEKQKAIELQAFAHFKRVRGICRNPVQLEKYDSAILRMFRKIGRPAKKDEPAKEKE